jgi:two-component system sensor histidine kinase/response regulator
LLTKLSGGCGVVVGISVIVGWYAHWPTVIQVLPTLPSMKYNTALGLMLYGVGLFLLTARRVGFAAVVGFLVTVLGALTLAEYIANHDFGIDQLVMNDYLSSTTTFPGRMSPLTAVSFTLVGIALTLTYDAKKPEGRLAVIAILLCMVGVIIGVAMLGYPFGVDTSYGLGLYTRMAVHTAATLLILSAGLLAWVRYSANRIDFNFIRWLPVTGSVTLVAMVAIISLASFTQLQDATLWRKHSYEVLNTAESILADLLDIQRGMRGYVLTGQPGALLIYEAGVSDAPRQLTQLEALTNDNPGQQERAKNLATDLNDAIAYSHKLLGARDNQGMAAAIQIEATGEGFAVVNRTIADLHVFDDEEHRLLGERSNAADVNVHNTGNLLIFGSGLAVILLITANLMASHEMQRRSRIEAQLQEIASLQEAILHSTDCMIISTDVHGKVMSFNSTAARWLGYPADEIIGQRTPVFWHDTGELAARARVLTGELRRKIEPGFEVFTAKVTPGKTDQNEWTLVRRDGSRFRVWLSASSLVDTAGRVIGYLSVGHDVTERKKAEKILHDQALILDLANDSIFIRDREDRITYWNQGAERLYGWSREEAMGHVTHELLKTEFPQPLAVIQEQLQATGLWKGELGHTRRDGCPVMVASSWTLQRDEANQPASVIEMNFDISARKRAEKDLARNRERLNTILHGSIDGVILYESIRDQGGEVIDFRFEMVNPAAERLMGTDASKLLGRTLLEKIPSAISDGLFEKFVHIVEKNEALDFEHLSTGPFPPRWHRFAGVKLGDGLVLSYTEITARKQYEQELQDAKRRAESADSAKSDFLANMSHEIRTPMNGVIGMTGLLLDTQLDAEQHSLAESIRSSGESLLGLINDILDFSKLEAGKMSFEELDFDLRKVLEETVELLAAQAQRKGLELVASVEPDVVTRLRGDPGRMQQVLTNLIGNAIKFTNSGEVAVRVLTESGTNEDVLLRFEIKDTGVGIPREAKTRLFQPFVQADGSTARMFGGTGLGLAICKRLAESMNGDIGVESYPGIGSKFWVTMRFRRQTEASPEVPVNPELPGTRALIVDDNRTSQQLLRNQVAAWKMRGGSAEGGEEALAILRQAVVENSPYQVAIIDLQMPGIDGLALARQIHADRQLSATRLILLTPFGKPIAADDLKTIEIAATCVKPVRQNALLECLVQALTQSPQLTGAPPIEDPTRATVLLPKRKERILLAEDNVVNQRVALGNLEKLGYTAQVVTNGIAVLEALENQKYDIILMDCQMPDLDGYQTTREIRQREKNSRHTWIIAMTANVMVGDREKCLAVGMDDYVSKPLRREELRAALDRVQVGTMPPLDEKTLRTLQRDGEDEFAELIELFITSAPGSIAEMARAIEESDPKALAIAAHTLKGSCSNWGPSPLRERCAEIEKMGRNGTVEGAADVVASANAELYRFVEALKPYRAPHPSP